MGSMPYDAGSGSVWVNRDGERAVVADLWPKEKAVDAALIAIDENLKSGPDAIEYATDSVSCCLGSSLWTPRKSGRVKASVVAHAAALSRMPVVSAESRHSDHSSAQLVI